ncbi:MAG: cysteine--tRNA ligase [Tenericutes bacterium]|nr:cysteine--tRNA ligase [Mycoplasmatota bacterium]
MKLYNTETRKIENFVPYNKDEVTMYTCGPTVYHYAHIGNLRTYISEDILEKTLNYLGFNVKRCMNITDVGHLSSDSDSGEDKMLKGAKREHKTVLEIASMYTQAFYDDLKKLNIKIPEIISPATENIDSYIKIITKLLEKGYAYISNGNVYFDVTKLDDYYRLTNHKEDEMVVGAREGVEEDLGKRNQSDFVLWFTKSKFEDQELKWESPWGLGYPGWHIECSCIALKNLGEHLDIHCGGVDNIFPHHTNEIAQTESYTGHKWCNFWFHGEHLNDKTGKMSKSKGEFLTVSLLESKGYDPLAYRFMCLQSHYRKQLLFSYESLDNAVVAYNKLKNKIKSLKNNLEGNIEEAKEKYETLFKQALENDLNTSDALTILYDVLKSNLNNKTKLFLVEEFDKVLSLDLLKEDKIDEELEKYILEKIEERNVAKKNKDYSKADNIREELESRGILISDTREGTSYQLK